MRHVLVRLAIWACAVVLAALIVAFGVLRTA